MEFCKSFFAALFIVMVMSSVTWTAPLSYRPSDAEIVIRLSLMPTRANATKEMLKVYQFIASNWDLKETSLVLGVADTPVCSSSLQKKDNLSIAFMQLYNFIHPLYLAYSYEEVKGSQHKVLASALKDTSFQLNITVWRVRREIKKTGSAIPTVQHISETSLDHNTRAHLQAMVTNKRVILKVYQFITTNWDLKETSLALGVADTPVCSSSLQKKDNLSIAFMQLYNFIHPLYLAYSYEEVKGSQHKVLASALKDTSFHLNNTVWRVRREIKKSGSSIPTVQHISETSLDHYTRAYLQAVVNDKRVIKKTGSSIPTVQHISEASLDHHTKTYLQAMVNNKRVSLTITDDVVKTYRNYVILYTLKDVLTDVLPCI
ncbi:hypothetical protein AWC38_SpisGene2556 [Stylophora pistillata]|uniref:Uncharacterized protein n=1 Tax=Stylophora pistillata TaxID=50429 RepID=A0A2B4SUS6_STYPI|nr:hypothetical protein AWC38_SpisGene2556 [Stylophora pistillata]